MLEGKPNKSFEIIYTTLHDSNNKLSIKDLCKYAKVSRSGYYRWLSKESKRLEREEADSKDFLFIKQAYEYRGYNKGIRGIHMRLLKIGILMNVKKIQRLMKKYGLMCPIRKANPYRRMAKAIKTSNYASNILNRRFVKLGPRTALLSDITYIPFKGHFIYLSVVIDAYTKEVLAYKYSLTLQEEFVKETLDELKANHIKEFNKDTMIHTDCGCHYTSRLFINTVEEMGLIRSMSRKGNCWDNAPQESFFGHMKDEIKDKLEKCIIDQDVFNLIDDWILYYNFDRPIWKLGKRTPAEFYKFLIENMSWKETKVVNKLVEQIN